MCEQTEIIYLDGDVVWVKLGSCWWPGEVCGFDKLPPGVLNSFRKKPIAVVKFFQEESFEYVKNINLIYKYNCSRKNEFIKKGLDLYRSKHTHMEKFPEDVSMAEQRTGGNPDIITDEEFLPKKKESYANIFGTPGDSSASTKKNTPGRKGRFSGTPLKWKSKSDSHDSSAQKITHPRILQKALKGKSDYRAHILVQKSTTCQSPCTPNSAGDISGSTTDGEETSRRIETSSCSPSPSSSQTPGLYSCHACTFTTTRLNVMILHNKSHSANFVPYTPIKKPKMKSKSKSVTLQFNDEDIINTSPVSKKKKSIKFESKPRGRPKLMDYVDSSSPLKTSNKDKSILSPPKRKYAKTKEKEAKKPKTDIEIKNSLLADWNEDSDEESMDVLSSLKLSQNISDSKKTSLAENKDDSQNQIEITDKTSFDIDESDVSIKSLKIGEKRPEKREQTSCFDFEEDEDLQIERLGRKIPRLTAKSEEISIKSMDASIETSNTISDASAENAASSEKGSSLGPTDNSSINYDSLQSEINDLLNETKVPELPTIPSMSNFQKSKLVKVPDKEKTNEPPPGKSIFKTKTFFRSRHSRSQDAIEKYVADNTSIDKPPTYMEDTIEAEKSSDHPSESLSDTVSQSSEGSLVEVLPVPTQTDSVKITKYAPKIQLKKMNAALTNKNKCTTNDENSKNSSITPTIEDTDERFSDNISIVKIDEDEKCEVIAPVKLLDNDEILNKNCTQASVKSVNVMDTHCKSRSTSDIVEKCQKALNASSPIESNSQISESPADFPSSTSHVLNDKENSDNSVINEMITEGGKLNSAKSETLKHENVSDDTLKEKKLTLSLDTDMTDANIIEKKTQNTIDDKKLSEDVIVKDELKTISPLPLKSSKLFQILDDKTKKKSPLKIISTKIIKPQGKEKILNFDVGSSQSKGASTQKQKIVIRRATPQHGDLENLSSKNSGKWNDDDVQTFTIEGSSESNDDLLDPQIKKVNKGSPKLNYPIKREEKQNEDVLFDINAMPIVLSNESLENEDTASKSILGNNSKRPEAMMTFKTATKPECSDKPKSFKPSIIVKSVLEKTNSPNILSKSPKGKTTKHVLVMDKTTGERKLVKAEDINEKQILQSEGKAAQTANITGKLGGAGDSEIFGSNSLKPITNATKIIQNKLLSDTPSGSTIMIITKGQGGQSKVVLTPDNPKFLLSKGKIHQMAAAPQNVTPKSTIATSTINRTKSSHSIINYSSQILNSEAPNLIVSDKSQQQLRAISKQKGTILNSKGQLVLPGNGSKRTILTTMPGQAILTSKGQLIAPQSSVITSTSKLTSNVNKPTTLIASPNQPLRQLKAVQPQKTLGKFRQETVLPSKCNTMLFKTNKSLNQNQTIIQGQLKDSSILLSQKPGTVMHLTTAQFQHLQQTGQLISAPNQRINLSHNKPGKLQQKFILHKYMGSKSEQSENNNSSIDRYPSPVPPLAPIHSDLNLNNQKLKENAMSGFENETNQQNTTDISMKSVNDDPKISDNDDSCDNLDKLIPATIIPTRKRENKELLQKADSKSNERLMNKLNETGNIYNQEISSLLSQELTKNTETKGSADTQIQQTATSLEEPQRQLIAIPAETIGGPPNSFFLCVEDNGTLTPIDNQPLVLENNQLVPMGIPAAAASEASNDSESLSASTNIEIPKSGMKDLNAQQVSEIPVDQTQQNILLNIGDQQILIDHQTLLSLLTEDGQPLVTNDGQQLVFQGSSQQILAALASNPELAGLLGGTQQIIAPATTEGFNFSSEVQTNVNQDILAAALAGTEVFPQDSLIHESLINIVTSGAEPVLMEIDTNPNIQNINPAPTVHTNVFETSSTLNQPIMSPLEIPTKKRSDDKTVDSGLLAISKNSNVPKNLEDSLAVIGVSTANVPTSLELPITVTNPRIAVKTTSPLSLSCTNLYQTPGLISNTMVSPGIGIYESETPSTLGLSSLIIPESQYGASKDISESNKLLNISSLEESNVKNKSLELYSATVDLSERSILNEGGSNLDGNQVEKNVDEKKLDQTELKSIPASSMPCLDDSSSESFSEDPSNQLTDVIQTKIYSPISMPILTDDLDASTSSDKKPEDDVSDVYPIPQSDASNSSKNESLVTSEENTATEISMPTTQEMIEKVDTVEPAFIDDSTEQLIEQSNDTESNEKKIEENRTAQEENGDDHSVVETIVEEETPLMNMEQIEDSKLETLTEVTNELSDKLDNINTNDDNVNLVIPEEDKQEPLNNENEMDISETDISAVKEIDDLKSNVDVSISKSIEVTKDCSPMENNIDTNLNEECDEICAETPPHLLEHESSIYDDEQVVSNEDLSKMQNEADGNSLPDHVCDDLNVSCSSESAALPDSTSPNLDISPATPEHPSESMHFSESSSDASTEIPIQPTISVSHHLVQNFSSMLNSVNPDDKCDDNNISDVSEHFDSNENTSPKSVKQNER